MVGKALAPVLVALSIACAQAQPEQPTTRPADQKPVIAGDTFRMPDVLEIVTKEGEPLRFEHTSSGSYGPRATNVIVGEADGLQPRVASCRAVGPANFHRDAPLGHHFQPELIDLKEAMTRTREIVEEVSYWPICPMTYEVQDERGENYRYCARKKGETIEPRRPDSCQR